MKTTLFAILLAAAANVSAWTSFENSPHNFANSPHNFDNSPHNFNNSPHNFANSPHNFQRSNGIYDTNGDSLGYTTRSPSGVINLWDNEGRRIGYGR